MKQKSVLLIYIDSEGSGGIMTDLSAVAEIATPMFDDITGVKKWRFTTQGHYNVTVPDALNLVGSHQRRGGNIPSCNEAAVDMIMSHHKKQISTTVKRGNTAYAFSGLSDFIQGQCDRTNAHPETFACEPILLGHNLTTEFQGLLPKNTQPMFGVRLADSRLFNDPDNSDFYKHGLHAIANVRKICTFMMMDPTRLPNFMTAMVAKNPVYTGGNYPILSCSLENVYKTMINPNYKENHNSLDDACDLRHIVHEMINYDGIEAFTNNTKSLINHKRMVVKGATNCVSVRV